MNLRYIPVLILFIGVFTLSCEKEASPRESISSIVSTTLPAKGRVGQEIVFDVRHGVANGCGKYASQRTVRQGKIHIVTFFAKYEGDFCTMNAPIRTSAYTFRPASTGTHTFKFDQGNQEFLVQSIVIE
jgi:hypothetical protein